MTIAEFLLARVAEDEAVATELRDQYPDSGGPTHLSGNWGIAQVTTGYDRVLAECVAKRAIVELHHSTTPGEEYMGTNYDPNCTGSYDTDAALTSECETLRLLAVVYADHPDYCDEWRP